MNTSDTYLKYDLQLFADDANGGEKTEEPTSKKIEDSRKEGQVAKSKELSNAASLLALFVCIKIFVGYLGERLVSAFSYFFTDMSEYSNSVFSRATAGSIILDTVIYIVVTSAPFLIIAFVVAFISQRVQIKWMVTAKPLQPDLKKLNPMNGFKRMFSKQSLFELFMSIIKVVLFSYVSYSVIKDSMGVFVSAYDLEIKDCLSILFDLVYELGLKISIIYLIISIGDYAFQKWKNKNDLKMTKQEVKDEFKNQEGDPHVKSQQKQRMNQASRRRMMQNLPQADVVITNPTHFAVALKYDNSVSPAPIVIAKGADYLAQKIKDIAKENDIEIVENKPLARMLYSNVEIGNEIPPELYQTVAEVLAYVYRIKNKVG